MNQHEYLSKLHGELLTIIEVVDKVCREQNLTYYLVGGSLLGTVRHNGFIPWDDDLDIGMPRKDFERFISIANTVLGEEYELQWITTNKDYWQVFAKVVRKDTLFKEPGLKRFQPHGIFIDIFPLDISSEYSPRVERVKRKIQTISSLVWQKNNPTSKFRYLLSRLFKIKTLQKAMIRIMKSAQKYGKTHYANFGSQYAISKQTMPVEWYGNGVRLPFEKLSLSVPAEYEKVLISIYGNNYMSLPPEDRRRCHYPEKVKFSDGMEVSFDKPSHVVSIHEQ